MKSFHQTFWIIFIPLISIAQKQYDFSVKRFSDRISFVYTDREEGLVSAVIEYPNFLVLLESPMQPFGGGHVDLSEDLEKTKAFSSFLNREFLQKPVRYVMSSHWHSHSLSGITPFFDQGATLVVAKSNWEFAISHGFLKEKDLSIWKNQIVLITKDTKLLTDTDFPIQVIFLDESYTNKPTDHYLFFYLPEAKCLAASCMCAMSTIDFSAVPEPIYSDRLQDLSRSIDSRNLDVDHIFRIAGEGASGESFALPVYSMDYFNELKARGKSSSEAASMLEVYDLKMIQTQKDSILDTLLSKKFPPGVINTFVYTNIKRGDYEKAVQWAEILNLYYIGEPNFLDTMGEAYYNAGEIERAKSISRQLVRLNPEFKDQFKVWESNKQ